MNKVKSTSHLLPDDFLCISELDKSKKRLSEEELVRLNREYKASNNPDLKRYLELGYIPMVKSQHTLEFLPDTI